jgi:PD-(D/E)XK endonuclease
MGLAGPKRHTDKTGDISEAAITVHLLQSGYEVLTPYGKNHRYDLMIEDADGKCWRVQCKTGWMDEAHTVITFATASSYNHTAKQKGWRSYKGQVDYFAVYVEQIGKVYLVPVNAVGAAKAMLRLTPTKNKQEKNIRWAQDYEL